MKIIKTTYKDQVIEHIYNLVLDGTLSAGDQLKENSLAGELGISRAPIREALKELASNGIIEYKPQVGSFVSQLSPKEIIDAYTTRGVLEGYAIMDSRSQFSLDELDELDSMAERMEKSAQAKNHRNVIELGAQFHDHLISKNNNVQLIEYTALLSKKLHILFYKHWGAVYTPQEIGDRHHRIIAALRSNDTHEIEITVRNHYAETGLKIANLQ